MLRPIGTLGVLFLAFGATALASTPLTFTEFGTVHNSAGTASSSSTAWAMNASGQATGYANPGTTNAFLYSGGSMIDVNNGGLDGVSSSMSEGFGINDSGTIVGLANDSSLSGARAFVTSGGSMTTLDAYDNSIVQSRAYGINSNGAVVGAYYTTGSLWNPLTYSYSGTYNATTGVYSGGTWSYTNIDGVLGGTTNSTVGGASYGMALAINNAGTVTGYAPSGANSNYSHAFVLTSGGTATDLGVLSGYNQSYGDGINAKGDVAGYSLTVGSFGYSAFLATQASGYAMTPLAMPAAVDDTLAYSVNKYDMVAGMGYLTASGNTSYDALLWTPGVVPFYGLTAGVTDLNTLAASVLPAGWVLNTARGINESGEIVGTGTYNGNSLAYTLSLPQAIPGDANLDGKVDVNDLTIVLSHFGQTTGVSWGTGDFNGDGRVDVNDLTIVLSNFGESVSTSIGGSLSAVPEPGSLLLAVLAAVGLLAFAHCVAYKR